MHDSEPDTFVYKTWPEKYSDMLKNIGIDSKSKEIGTDEIEKVIITVDIFLKLQE